jgi:hypothetical protein
MAIGNPLYMVGLIGKKHLLNGGSSIAQFDCWRIFYLFFEDGLNPQFPIPFHKPSDHPWYFDREGILKHVQRSSFSRIQNKRWVGRANCGFIVVGE